MKTNQAMPMFNLFAGHCDGAKWGPSDFYSDRRAILGLAIATGRDFDTGVYGVKKEIESAQVSRKGDIVTCKVWVSDDFDTEGSGVIHVLTPGLNTDQLMDHIESALCHACDKAREEQHDNRQYRGFAVGRTDAGGRRVDWLHSLILPAPEDIMLAIYVDESYPCPGDYYEWGWNDGSCGDPIPEDIAAELRAWAEGNLDAGPDTGLTVRGWRIEPWG